jgi:hypothetical protein
MNFDQFAHATTSLNPDLKKRNWIGPVLGVVGSSFVPSSPNKELSYVRYSARQKVNFETATLKNRLRDRDAAVEGERQQQAILSQVLHSHLEILMMLEENEGEVEVDRSRLRGAWT